MLCRKLSLVERSESAHSVEEGGKGGIVDHVSQRGGDQFHNSRVLKNSFTFHLHSYTFCLQIYHVTLNRLDLFKAINLKSNNLDRVFMPTKLSWLLLMSSTQFLGKQGVHSMLYACI